jgi:uncharacterized UBP type Zn finger protein
LFLKDSAKLIPALIAFHRILKSSLSLSEQKVKNKAIILVSTLSVDMNESMLPSKSTQMSTTAPSMPTTTATTGNNDISKNLDRLVMMGFDRTESQALLERNGNDFNEALSRLTTNTNSGGSNNNNSVPERLLEQLMMMGFDRVRSRDALLKGAGNLQRAIQILSTPAATATNVTTTTTTTTTKSSDVTSYSDTEQLEMMGFSRDDAAKALLEERGDIQKAIHRY